jgi:hypothetical protein
MHTAALPEAEADCDLVGACLQMFAATAQGAAAPQDMAAPPMQQEAPGAAHQQMPSPAYNGIGEQGLPPRKRKAPGRD